jgi:hypothetical protein
MIPIEGFIQDVTIADNDRVRSDHDRAGPIGMSGDCLPQGQVPSDPGRLPRGAERFILIGRDGYDVIDQQGYEFSAAD